MSLSHGFASKSHGESENLEISKQSRKFLEQYRQCDDKPHDASEVSEVVFTQSFDTMKKKLKQRTESNLQPLSITKPVAFSEEVLQQFDWCPTVRIYLKAYKLVKKDFEILDKSNFTDGRGITLIVHGYLTQNSILQAFPQVQHFVIFKLCEENLSKNPSFFEGLLLSYVLQRSGGEVSEKSSTDDSRKVMCLTNLIHYIQKAEPNSRPIEDPFEFDKNYSSWLHVLYCHIGAYYTIVEENAEAAKAFENSLTCCPSYYDSKRLLGYNLMYLYFLKNEEFRQHAPAESSDIVPDLQRPNDREMSKYDSWTAKKLYHVV